MSPDYEGIVSRDPANIDIFSLIGNSNLFNIRLRLTSPDSIILWAGGSSMDMESDFIMLAVQDGFVQVGFPSSSPYLRPENFLLILYLFSFRSTWAAAGCR